MLLWLLTLCFRIMIALLIIAALGVWGLEKSLQGDPESMYSTYFSSPPLKAVKIIHGREAEWLDYSGQIDFVTEKPVLLKKIHSYVPVACDSSHIMGSAFSKRLSMTWEEASAKKITSKYFDEADALASSLVCYAYKGQDEDQYQVRSWLVQDTSANQYFFYISGNSKPPLP